MTKLPDAEKLCEQLAAELKPRIGPKTAMIGIHTGGAWVAERLHALLGLAEPLGLMDIAFYRDDYARAGPARTIRSAPRSRSTSTAASCCWSTTCSTPAAPCARR